MPTLPQKHLRDTKTKSPTHKNIFFKFKNWSINPTGIIVLIGGLILVVEILTMELLYTSHTLVYPETKPEFLRNVLDAVILAGVVTPTLYFLIFRRVAADSQKFNKITSAAQDAVIVMDTNGRVSFWNAAAERIFGYTSDEALGQDLHILIAPTKSLNAFSANFEHFQETGDGPILNMVREVVAQRKSGEQFYAELSVSAMLTDEGWSAIGIVRDITDRKRRESALRERDQELAKANEKLADGKAKDEAIMESLGEGLIATDKTGAVITINHAAEKMTGWKKEEIIGKKVLEAIPAVDEQGNRIPEEKRPAYIALTTGIAPASENFNLLVRNDGTIPVAATATPVKIGDETIGAVLIFRDITKEQELEVTRRDLLSLASHQLRTPLSGTKWLIETLRNKLFGPLTEKQEEYLDQIYKINEGMTELVHDMLGVLRMEGDTTEAKKEQVATEDLFATVVENLGSAAKSKNISLHIEVTNKETIETDSMLLRQIIESLVSNAINYSPEGSSVFLSAGRVNDEILFTVKDSGIGIPEEEQRQIFERFYRATNAKIYDTKGTGLGLYIASTLAKKLGARISFQSKEKMGTTFYVHFPIPQK